MQTAVAQLPDQLTAYAKGGFAVLVDDSVDNLPSVLTSPAKHMTTSGMNEALARARGVPFVALSRERVQAFALSEMARPRTNPAARREQQHLPQMCVSVEAREGVSTGISAADRARTVALLGEDNPQPRSLVSPGHIFPVAARDGGVLIRNALPEAALDLCRISGCGDAAFFIDLLGEQGELLSGARVEEFCSRYGYPLIQLSAVVRHRLATESLVHRVAEARLPTRIGGEFRAVIYRSPIHSGDHLALVKGSWNEGETVLTRVQLEFTFGDVFGGDTPPSRSQIDASLDAISKHGSGVFIYLRRAVPGQLREQIDSWQSKFNEKPASMMREYGLGAQILRDLGVRKIELLTESRRDYAGIDAFGLEIAAQRPIEVKA